VSRDDFSVSRDDISVSRDERRVTFSVSRDDFSVSHESKCLLGPRNIRSEALHHCQALHHSKTRRRQPPEISVSSPEGYANENSPIGEKVLDSDGNPLVITVTDKDFVSHPLDHSLVLQ
jgi:hypothetical protein